MSNKIIGNTTATPTPRSNWTQQDETKADFILNKPENLTYIDETDNETVTGVEIVGVSESVLYIAQALSDAQKNQARENIGAVSAEYVIRVFEELKALIKSGGAEEAVAVLDAAILDLAVLA